MYKRQLALGYRFEDVLPVNEEDLGIYKRGRILLMGAPHPCLLYTSDAADERSSVDLGGRRIIKKKKHVENPPSRVILHNLTHIQLTRHI